jgi:fumarate reductase iron-sulfur subunit
MSHILHQPVPTRKELGDPILAEIFRFDPSGDAEPHLQTYCVPYYHRMSIFTLLREIYEHQDRTLAFRNQQCGRGICGTCQFRIGVNGKLVKGCTIPLNPGDHVTIEPHNRNKVIRDLVVSF